MSRRSRHNRRDFIQGGEQPQALPLGKAHLIKSPMDKQQITHYVFEKRLQAAGQVFGSAVGIALTSEQFAQVDQETKDKILAGLAESAWNAAPFLLQQADLLDMVKKTEDTDNGANGGQEDEAEQDTDDGPGD